MEAKCDRINERNSEIVNQKKQFIFDVEQTSSYVFPREVFSYYVYIKNVSGSEINNFVIKIENDEGLEFVETDYQESTLFNLFNGEVRLYEFKATCIEPKEYTVHFIAYGEGTQILFKTLKIKCNLTYNSDKLIHKISIYDFTPYEETYSMEADNYSETVTQLFKRQKLPYKAGEQPFPLKKSLKWNEQAQDYEEDRNFVAENIESESLIEQLDIKNTNEHVYQYISRESFIEDTKEVFEGENLQDIIQDINENSEYFRATFLRTGTNSLLNDFTQYKPNGLIYRLGLMSSEIYHTLGVIPTYSYMTDMLFKWAPHKSGHKIFMNYSDYKSELLNLYPQEKGMQWGRNIWAGTGWFVHQIVTDEYKETTEYKQKKEEKLIEDDEIILDFEDKESAISFIKKQEEIDNGIREKKKSDIVKFKYVIEESIYEHGVFFVNIPVKDIPANFIIPDSEALINIINRVKPYGVKPILNYVIEKTFKHEMDQKLLVNYDKYITFTHDKPIMLYRIYQSQDKMVEIECDGTSQLVPQRIPIDVELYDNYAFTSNIKQTFDIPNITFYFDKTTNNSDNRFKMDTKQEGYLYINELNTDEDLRSLGKFKKMLYLSNYDKLSFYMISEMYPSFSIDNNDLSSINQNSFKLQIGNRETFNLGEKEIGLEVKDIYGAKHRLSVIRDALRELDSIKYTYINTNSKNILRKEGLQNIKSIVIDILDFDNKKILLFLVEDNDIKLHYFHHIVIQNVVSIDTFSNTNIKPQNTFAMKATEEAKIVLETPYVLDKKTIDFNLIENGNNWENLYRLDKKETSYAYITNLTKDPLLPNEILLHYEDFTLPKTSIIKELRLKINGSSSKNKQVFILNALQTNHFHENSKENSIQFRPNNIECYKQQNESTKYYQIKLNQSIQQEQESLIEYYNNLIEENSLFNELVRISTEDYKEFDDFITIHKEHWIEVSEFIDSFNSLNETKEIKFVLEGYNKGDETEVYIETSAETSYSSRITEDIPRGYFYKEISVPYPNKFFLEDFRVKFRFKNINKEINIFSTNLNVDFVTKEDTKAINFNYFDKIDLNDHSDIILLTDYIYPEEINNGVDIKLTFDELDPGEFYKLNDAYLEVTYENTETNLLISNNRYEYSPNKGTETTVTGQATDCYLSGLFYNDLANASQAESNISSNNHGIELTEALFQEFEAKENNITGIEVYPNGFVGNPNEVVKIGIYNNVNNTPGKLLKEVYANGWVKNNSETKSLASIKYNINVSDLKIGETYWFKIEVEVPQKNSYYLLRNTTEEKIGYKLLLRENNNYINTFSSLEFIIYSQNLSKSFNNFAAVQELYNNPFISVGLHKNKGTITNLMINQYQNMILCDDFMSEDIKMNCDISFKIIRKEQDGNEMVEKETITSDNFVEEE